MFTLYYGRDNLFKTYLPASVTEFYEILFDREFTTLQVCLSFTPKNRKVVVLIQKKSYNECRRT